MANTNCPTSVKDLMRRLKVLKVEVVRSRSNHLKFYYDGRLIASSASTPSDIRTIRNTVGDLRRAGIDVKAMVVNVPVTR